jgi:hypothetical protein
MLAEVGVKPRKPEAAKIISFLEKTLTDGGGILGCCKSSLLPLSLPKLTGASSPLFPTRRR